MNIFFYLLQRQIGTEQIIYPTEEFVCFPRTKKSYFENPAYFHCMQMMYQMRERKDKFSVLQRMCQNTFYTESLQNDILDIFCRTQRYYMALNRFIHICRLKRHYYVVRCDLSMESLFVHHPQTFILVEPKANFLFRINELVSIVENAIGHSPEFYSEPKWPANPYNNNKLTSAALYSLYFQVQQSSRVMPLLFHLFFLCNFNPIVFSEKYEMVIREQAIEKYVMNSPYTLLLRPLIIMLSENVFTRRWVIHPDFPAEKLVSIFRPYLLLFYYSNYMENTTRGSLAGHSLNIQLKAFYFYNRFFGRKIYKLTKCRKRGIKIKSWRFHMDYLRF
jgi:hypothetical protein